MLRRIYHAPELFQLLATFALVLVIKDVALWIWGAGGSARAARARACAASVDILGSAFPEYDLFLIAIGPLVLGALWLLLNRTRWGTLVRAATQDREMVGALGVNQKWLFTGVFALGALLAGLGGALQIPREPAQLFLDLDRDLRRVRGRGRRRHGQHPRRVPRRAADRRASRPSASASARSSCSAPTFSFSKLTLVVEFIVMAIVLVLRPWGLLGRPQGDPARRPRTHVEPPLRPADAGAQYRRDRAASPRSPRCRSPPPATRSCC